MYMLPDFFLLFSFPCSADHERDWPPCKNNVSVKFGVKYRIRSGDSIVF